MRDKAINDIKTELAAVTEPSSADFASSTTPEDLFSFGQQTLQAEVQDELSCYLLVPVYYPLSQMNNFEGLNQLFFKYNTSVPSSTSVEWLFNIANQVLAKKRVRQSDSKIVIQLLLSSNKGLYIVATMHSGIFSH